MKKTHSVAGMAALIVLLAGGCASAGSARSPFGAGAGADEQEISIAVRNLNWNEARLYALSGGRRIRLGTVGGNQDARYSLDWDLSLPLAIEIQLVAGPTCTTPELRVDPGDEIELQIESSAPTRNFCRYF